MNKNKVLAYPNQQRMKLKISIISLGLLLLGHLNKHNPIPPFSISKQASAINVRTAILEKFHLGYKRLWVDSLWLATLLESDLEHYKKKDLNSWMYLRFQTISTLDPAFLTLYEYAGIYLSIIKNDIQGSIQILKKGLEFYPESFELNFNLGFNYFFELQQPEKALPFFDKIKFYPKAPLYLTTLVAKIKMKQGDKQSALKLIKEASDKMPPGSAGKKYYLNYLENFEKKSN
ncbi:MAG: hypothetical protein KBD63_02550 [Bacteriovoracaceae bacterium]|nr:hypothetical protein [Bacteriovoracaceae bacterium]